MLWQGRRESDNVEDRRGSGGQIAIGGGIIGVIFLLVNYFLTGDPAALQQLPQAGAPQETRSLSPAEKAREDNRASFVKVVLADTEDVWSKIFSEHNEKYQPPTLILFSGATQSACGTASSASGPFYCPGDNDLYIDLAFADELQQRFGAKGDFAMAYVVAHEVGHHIQFLMGTTQKMDQIRRRVDEVTYNKYSVALELQADFYAGVWAHYDQKMKNVIQPQDIEQALQAASAVGDDNIQERTQGYVVPEGFTHGTSAQRMYWFKRGYETGDINQGNTFAGIN
ncbi:MAG: metalloprotease [Niastella sp. SCN 39-18]|nr:neutral zinc metallopeptidase [Sphingobacteriales bacterium]ODT53322.1 MAG: metalloprotease [Niastella sp. SCN 39-18]OJW08587.1 MAG: metalloprotease [Sphingobacteriales bacterium 39-19]